MRFIVMAVVAIVVIVVVSLIITAARTSGKPTYGMRDIPIGERIVPCLIYQEGTGSGTTGGISCDWANARAA